MTPEEKQDIIELIKSFKPYNLKDEENKRVAEAIDEITHAIDGMANTNDWIECSDMMPPEREYVLCYSKINGISIGLWIIGTDFLYAPNEQGVWLINGGIQTQKCVTHWMYLLEPPKSHKLLNKP